MKRRLASKSAAPSFRFRDRGKLAVIRRSAAVADLAFMRAHGRIAWLFWLFVHLTMLVDFQNRLTVLVQWGWSYFTQKRNRGRPSSLKIDDLYPHGGIPHVELVQWLQRTRLLANHE